jgi:drug/metabolite transporter (DMT)-like permease
VDKIDFGCALISYVGVFIVSRPAFLFSESISSPAPNAVSVLCALLGAFFQACAYICMRKLHDVHFVVIIHYFLLTAIALTIFILILTGQTIGLPTNGKIIMSILGGGFFASVGQVFMTLGFQQEKAGIASVMRYFDIIFVLFWDIVILQEEVHLLSILGGLVVLGSAIIIALRKAKKSN